MDVFDHGYAGRIMLYICCSLLDSMWQTTTYWLIGAMSNDPAKLAYFAGFCTILSFYRRRFQVVLISGTDKSIQSAGAAGAWAADGDFVPYASLTCTLSVLITEITLFAGTWQFLVAPGVFLWPALFLPFL
jgi:hypothetical protein